MDDQNATTSVLNRDATSDEATALQHIISELSPLAPGSQKRLIDTVCTFLGIATNSVDTGTSSAPLKPLVEKRTVPFQFTEQDDEPSVKQFLLDKSPTTDVERVACLAYYLAHYRATPHVKTKDITALNTEAAQRRFSNTAVAVDNATKAGYLVPSIKGHKQLSAFGERFVAALPDRDTAREIMERARQPRSRSSKRFGSGTI